MSDRRQIAVIGGGPAGAFAASLLAAAGKRVTIFDERMAWEKPCGGGLTRKALERYPFLEQNGSPKKIVRECELSVHGGPRVHLQLRDPIYIYSRFVLNRLLLERAESAGCELIQDRIGPWDRRRPACLVGTKKEYTADYVIIATGARNSFPELAASKRDSGMTLGYFVPGTCDTMDVEFQRGLAGYLWTFPRSDHLSVGVCGPLLRETSPRMRERLEDYMRRRGFAREDSRFFSHRLPSLGQQSWPALKPAGPGWAGVGDAAGLVDPITGEGLYYALRSAELMADCYLQNRMEEYPRRLRADFARDLEFGARIHDRFFLGRFIGAPVITRMIQFAARSATFRGAVQDLFTGSQGYLGLKQRLERNLKRTLAEIVASSLRPTRT